MKVRYHVALSAAISGALWFHFRSQAMLATSLLSGIFIDLDHFLDYFLEYGTRFSRERFFRASYEGGYERAYLVLHGWEWLPVLGLLVFLARGAPWAIGLAVGWGQHLLSDQLANHPAPLGYFLAYRWKHKFAYSKAFPFLFRNTRA